MYIKILFINNYNYIIIILIFYNIIQHFNKAIILNISIHLYINIYIVYNIL